MGARDAIRLGEKAEATGDFLDALAAYRSALADADPLVVADAHFHIGRVAWRQSRLDDAMEEYAAARALAIQHGDTELRARVENGMGVIHYTRGELEQARAAYTVALDLSHDDTQRGRVHLNLGAIANIQGDLEAARRAYQQSRTMFKQSEYPRGEVLALHNLGMLYADEERWDAADEAYRDCLELLEGVGDRGMIAKVLIHRSEVSCARERFDEAVSNCDLAIALVEELGDEVERAEALRWKGHALRRLGQHADAEDALVEALRPARRLGLKLNEAEILYDLGESQAARGAREESRKSFTRALDLFLDLGATREIEELRKRLEA